jgi:hypothetical protein
MRVMELLKDMDFASEVFLELFVKFLEVDGFDSYKGAFLLYRMSQ